MKIYKKNERKQMRHELRRYRWRINHALAVLAVLAVLAGLLATTPAQAAPRCPGGTPTPQGCIYQPKPGTACAWPARIIKVGKVTICMQAAEETQP